MSDDNYILEDGSEVFRIPNKYTGFVTVKTNKGKDLCIVYLLKGGWHRTDGSAIDYKTTGKSKGYFLFNAKISKNKTIIIIL